MRSTRASVIRVAALLTAGLTALGLTVLAPAASAATCPDPTNTDCPAPPSESQFVHLIDDTQIYFGPGPIAFELVERVQAAQDALHPPSPIHPPAPIRAYHLLGGYLNQVRALSGTANGAAASGTVVLTDEASALRSQISAAYPTLELRPGPSVRPGT